MKVFLMSDEVAEATGYTPSHVVRVAKNEFPKLVTKRCSRYFFKPEIIQAINSRPERRGRKRKGAK